MSYVNLGTCAFCVMPFVGSLLFWDSDGKDRYCEECFRKIFRREPENPSLCEICGRPARLMPDRVGLIIAPVCAECKDGAPEYHEATALIARLAGIQLETADEAEVR